MTTIVSGCHPAGYVEYGRNFLTSFAEFWPRDIALHFFMEDLAPLRDLPGTFERRERVTFSSVFSCPGLQEFIDRHKNTPERCGRAPNERWKQRQFADGYNYRFDAVRFVKQLFYPESAAMRLQDGEILSWFDADVVTLKPVPAGFIEKLLGDADLVYLGREPKHTELGFWAVRLNPKTRHFLTALADEYRSDEVFSLPEWHSAYVFDTVRKTFFGTSHPKMKSLTPGGRGHVWHQCALGDYSDHLKGGRKALGRSPEARR